MVSWPIVIPQSCPFPLENLPFGFFSTKSNPNGRVGAAIGDLVLDLAGIESHGLFGDILTIASGQSVFRRGSLNDYASHPLSTRSRVRNLLLEWLRDPNSPLFTNKKLNEEVFIPMKDALMHLPFKIGGFTDFMCSDTHIDNVSAIGGGTAPIGYRAFPRGYHSRASGVIVPGEPVHRPQGIVKDPATGAYALKPSGQMDYEAELGVFISTKVPKGITPDQAQEYIFGFVILNDWSARDIQFTEMIPLGPLNGKAFATTISPWVVTLDALRHCRCISSTEESATNELNTLPHLKHGDKASTWDLEIHVSVQRNHGAKEGSSLVSSISNLRDLRWSPGQMIAHLSASGSVLSVGDLIGTGTISSPARSPTLSFGCLAELNQGGQVGLGNSENELIWLEDGDEVIMSVKERNGAIGLGTMRSVLLSIE